MAEQRSEFSVDELAQAAGTTVRKVRLYQDRGLLPPPERRGRVGVYSAAHLARLRLIGQLLARGYTFAHITELVGAWEHGHDLGQLLGLETALTGPWSDEVPTYLGADELSGLFGGDMPPELVDQAVAQGFVEAEGERFRVQSPRLLHAGAELVGAGVPLAAVLDLAAALRREVEAIATRFVDVAATHLVDPLLRAGGMPPDEDLPAVAALVHRLRPLAQMAVDAELAAAMERVVHRVFGERLVRLLDAQAVGSPAPAALGAG